MMERLDAPTRLRRAREEMLGALDALRPEDEDKHKANAEELIVTAVRSIQEHPRR